jgi:hypothetical protein
MSGPAKAVALFLVSILLITMLVMIGWQARGIVADRDMAEFKNDLANKAEQQRGYKFVIESEQDKKTAESTQRLDIQQAAQQQETVYVEKKVIEYRDRWRDRACGRPTDWVQLYNESLFGNGAAVSKTP